MKISSHFKHSTVPKSEIRLFNELTGPDDTFRISSLKIFKKNVNHNLEYLFLTG